MRRPFLPTVPVFLALLAALGLLGAGCGEKSEPDPSSVPDPPAAATAPISFAKGGGIAGISQRLLITKEGRAFASLQRDEPLQAIAAAPRLIATARRYLGELDFANLDLPPAQPVADEFTYVVTYGDQRVAGGETQLRENRELSQAIGALDAILAGAAGNGPSGSKPSG